MGRNIKPRKFGVINNSYTVYIHSLVFLSLNVLPLGYHHRGRQQEEAIEAKHDADIPPQVAGGVVQGIQVLIPTCNRTVFVEPSGL